MDGIKVRRERMRAFERSGIMETPAYAWALRYVAIGACFGLAVGIYRLATAPPPASPSTSELGACSLSPAR